MKENNNCNDACRPAKKNTKIISVIVAVAITTTLCTCLSLTPTTIIGAQMDKPIIMHFHPSLNLMIDGKLVTVPSKIGIDSSLCIDHSIDQSWLHALVNGM